MSLDNRLLQLATALGQDMKALIEAVNDVSIGPPLSVVRSDEDINNIFTTVSHFRADGTLYRQSVLSGGTSPNYTTRTITYYLEDGQTAKSVQTYVLTYNANGVLVSEMLQP